MSLHAICRYVFLRKYTKGLVRRDTELATALYYTFHCCHNLQNINKFVCMNGSGCLYAVVQTRSPTPEQDRKPANKAYHDEAGTEQFT